MIILSVIIIIGFYTAFKALGACHPCNYTLDAFKTILGANRHVITANTDHDSTTARPDHSETIRAATAKSCIVFLRPKFYCAKCTKTAFLPPGCSPTETIKTYEHFNIYQHELCQVRVI